MQSEHESRVTLLEENHTYGYKDYEVKFTNYVNNPLFQGAIQLALKDYSYACIRVEVNNRDLGTNNKSVTLHKVGKRWPSKPELIRIIAKALTYVAD